MHAVSTPIRSYSQFGEDVQIWECLNRTRDGFFVEVGASHPTALSQTRLLELQGWRGILVEPIAAKCVLLRAERPESLVVEAAAGAPEQRGRADFFIVPEDDTLSGLRPRHATGSPLRVQVDVRTLDEILDHAGNPRVDFLSVDVEGTELDVLRGFDLPRHRPEIVLVEDHLPDLSVHLHMRHRGYRLVRRTGCNSWYVPGGSTRVPCPLATRLALVEQVWLRAPARMARSTLRAMAGRRASRG